MRAYAVPGLGADTIASKGWIVFCKTRACNAVFYKWWFKEVMVPWIVQLRQHSGLMADDPFLLTLDGEFTQIQMYMEDPEIARMCEEEYKIIVLKGPASS